MSQRFWTHRSPWLAAIFLAVSIGSNGFIVATEVAPPSPTTTRQDAPLDVHYVFSPTCAKCREASKVVDGVAARFGPQIRIHRLNVQDPDALDRVMELEDRYHVAAAAPPRIFVGSRCLTGLEQISAQLDTAVAAEIKLNCPAASQPDGNPTSRPH